MCFAQRTSQPAKCTFSTGNPLFCPAIPRNGPSRGEGELRVGLPAIFFSANLVCFPAVGGWSKGAAALGSASDRPKVEHQTSSSIPLLWHLLQDTRKFPFFQGKIHYKSPLEIIQLTNKKAKLGIFPFKFYFPSCVFTWR